MPCSQNKLTLGNVSRARVTQIMNLLQLAPEIQEALLFLPRTAKGRDPIRENHIRPIAAELEWRKQRRLWKGLAFEQQAGRVDDDAHSEMTYPDRIQPMARGDTSAAPLS